MPAGRQRCDEPGDVWHERLRGLQQPLGRTGVVANLQILAVEVYAVNSAGTNARSEK